jgi:hypothetical protein
MSNVSGTLRSPYSGRLIHELKWEKSSGAEMGMHRVTSPFVGGKYGRKRIIQQYQFLRRQICRLPFSFLSGCTTVSETAEMKEQTIR